MITGEAGSIRLVPMTASEPADVDGQRCLVDKLLPGMSCASHLLATLRKEGAERPDEQFLLFTPITWDLEQGREFWRARWQRSGISGRLRDSLPGRWVAVDLDDTVLMGSFTAKTWGRIGDGVPSIQRGLLATDWLATGKRFLRGAPERVACRRRHRFLRNPTVEVAFRAGLIEGLLELQSLGLGIVVVTASARPRFDFLCRRFPALAELVSGQFGRIVAAECLAEVALRAEAEPDSISDTASARAHASHPRSLAVKTPWAVSCACGISEYDLLVDDSATTLRVFREVGLAEKLLPITGAHPWSGYGIHILDTAVARLLGLAAPVVQSFPLTCPVEFVSPSAHLVQPPKVEDPLYFPLLHYRDQF